MKNVLTKEEEILRQVELAKKSQFAATGIKVELEAVFGRRSCSRKHVECPVENCTDGSIPCSTCNRDGCAWCNFDGYKTCSRCYFLREDWSSDYWCQQWILRELHKYGLSVKKRDTGEYKPKLPLVFGRFYTDPSVDAEFTFTMSLKNPSDIFLVPKVIEVFKKIGTKIGHGIDTNNAGMHVSLLRSKTCYYPERITMSDNERACYTNFEKSMRLLMPALFFLGSSNERSRGMHFREPRVSDAKFSAIHWCGNALEFRVFETCYDDPEQILDNFVVMRNCLRFWSKKYRSPKLEKITSSIKFGNDNGSRVDRLYTTTTHLEILTAGVIKLKPSYKTLTQLKLERNFKVNKNEMKKQLDKAKADAEAAYCEYDSRYEWRKELDRIAVMQSVMSRYSPQSAADRQTIIEQASAEAEERVRDVARAKYSKVDYVRQEVKKFIDRNSGQYSLSV